MPDIQLRPVSPKDAGFLFELMNEPSALSVLHELPSPLSMWEETIPAWEEDPDEEDHIILLNGRPAGWLGINGLLEKTAYIKMLVLLPEYRSRGVGTAALTQALEMLKQRRYASAALYTDAANRPARRCYEKCGFAVTENLSEEMADGSIVPRVRMEVVL